ncbi:hypothetical protein KW530_06640 [Vibrio fluvialis]|nr:hypothetical protein [Vibrio fluvialis]MBY7938154.1 hypothetical protein [Vibrio fluvialis]MBY8165411.1 hypothetical protein [Vibrio fluvialis]MBY8256241.1 hypothetical protein [Vibrio fluvialis]MBY8264800.1 hypothetical protein [Vibrio fluvialis]
MKHLKIINTLLFFILVIAFISINRRSELPVDGYYKRNEVIIMNNEDRIELKTNVDFLSKEEKYTSIVNISDIYNKKQYSSFSINGDIYSKDGILFSKTKKIEEVEQINKPVVFIASSSPIVSQIQKYFLGVDIYKERRYQYLLADKYFCYYDVDKIIVRCME